MAVLARGSTGCSIVCGSSSPSVEIAELDLTLLLDVLWVSALCSGLKREEILPLCLAEDYTVSVLYLKGVLVHI